MAEAKDKKKNRNKDRNIALKLNARIAFMNFLSFIALDILFITIIFVGSVFYLENSSGKIVRDVKSLDSVTMSTSGSISLGHYDISYSDEKPKNIFADDFFKNAGARDLRDAHRVWSLNDSDEKGIFGVTRINYSIYEPLDQGGYLVVKNNIGNFYRYAIYGMMVLLVGELVSLINTIVSSRKIIAHALEPLRELSEATKAFSDAQKSPSGEFSEDALKSLAKAMDSINASQLDTRIPADILTEELMPLAEAINEMLNRIDESYNAQIRFVSDASHELRTPITIIQGYANLLSRWGSEDTETLQESIEAIRTETESMKQLVNQLLFLARGDNESMKLDWQDIDAGKVISEISKEIMMIDKTHEIITNVDESVIVYGDTNLLKQLLRILTDNSLKYTPDGGTIRLNVSKDGAYARISVQDEGIGIPDEYLPHIFDRFYRTDESRARETGGAGLGLSIAKWITEKHGGHLEVISREGLGTRFTVILPLRS